MLYYNTKIKKRLRLTIIFTLLLVSCRDSPGETAKLPAFKKGNVAVNATYGELLSTIDYATFALLYENGWPLAFYIYQKGCHYVRSLEPVLYDYLKTTNLLLFAFDYADHDFALLQENYATRLNFKGTPAFYFWQKDYFYETVTGITNVKSLSLMTETFNNLLFFYKTEISFNNEKIKQSGKSITVTLSFTDETALKFIGSRVLPLIESEHILYINSQNGKPLTFYFSDTEESLVYTSTTADEIIERIRLYYL